MNNCVSLIESFPQKGCFPSSMPRYPNLWFLVSQSFLQKIKPYSRFHGHRKASELIWELFQWSADLVDDYEVYHTAEGCDAVGRRRGLQWIDLQDEAHDHSLHVRFYHQALEAICIDFQQQKYYAVAASVHYEVDRPEHLHPYVDQCPICGCTDQFSSLYEPDFHNLSTTMKNLFGHDPLGVEMSLFGTIKGKKVPLFSGLIEIEKWFDIQYEIIAHEQLRQDMQTGNLGLLIINDFKKQ